jgi:hypothetical protein
MSDFITVILAVAAVSGVYVAILLRPDLSKELRTRLDEKWHRPLNIARACAYGTLIAAILYVVVFYALPIAEREGLIS